MKIACFALTYNEEKILPHFINHYKQFCDDIIIYDNMSTDKTKQIAIDKGCKVIPWEAPLGGMDDRHHLQIKSTCYKELNTLYDWVITVDCDEFFTHRDGIEGLLRQLEELKESGFKLPDVQGYNMFSWDYDFNDPIEVIKLGIPSDSYSKNCIFHPSLKMEWTPGCHKTYNIIDAFDTGIILKHYKYINYDYVCERSKCLEERQSETNRKLGFNTHYKYSADRWRDYFISLEQQAITV